MAWFQRAKELSVKERSTYSHSLAKTFEKKDERENSKESTLYPKDKNQNQAVLRLPVWVFKRKKNSGNSI